MVGTRAASARSLTVRGKSPFQAADLNVSANPSTPKSIGKVDVYRDSLVKMNDDDDDECSEDEILLSPNKRTSHKRRSDNNNIGSPSPGAHRQPKRLKSSHDLSRNNDENLLLSPPRSFDRGRSASPSRSPNTVPHLDLTTGRELSLSPHKPKLGTITSYPLSQKSTSQSLNSSYPTETPMRQNANTIKQLLYTNGRPLSPLTPLPATPAVVPRSSDTTGDCRLTTVSCVTV